MLPDDTHQCRACAWWEPPAGGMVEFDTGTCHREPQPVTTHGHYWCRHFAKTRGWLDEQE